MTNSTNEQNKNNSISIDKDSALMLMCRSIALGDEETVKMWKMAGLFEQVHQDEIAQFMLVVEHVSQNSEEYKRLAFRVIEMVNKYHPGVNNDN